MTGIDLMVLEHKTIKKMLTVVRNMSYGILNGEEINYKDFARVIDFIRNFADAHHHAKEEKILFNRMEEEIGETAKVLVRHGMLVEHDLGRLYISQLEKALEDVKGGNDFEKINVIANAVGYTNLLDRHIDKEDSVVYEFAKKNLSAETLIMINQECELQEADSADSGLQSRYYEIVDELVAKYCK